MTAVTGATGYNVYQKSGTSSSVTVTTSDTKTDNGTSLTFSATSLTNTNYYAFISTAISSYGEGDPSTMQLVVPVPNSFKWDGNSSFMWYWPTGADTKNTTGATQKFQIQQSADGVPNWVNSGTPIEITNNSQYRYLGGTPGYWYRAAHVTNSIDSFISLIAQRPF